MQLSSKLFFGVTTLALSACATPAIKSSAGLNDAATPSTAVEPDTAVTAVPLASSPTTTSPFVGRYNGNSFETAMGMLVAPDGTFQWGLSVGGLDLRARGTWEQRGDVLFLTSDPKPVPPEIRFLSIADRSPDAEDDKLVYVTRPDGEPFTYAEARIECANGARFTEFVAGSNAYLEDYEPPECDRMSAITVEQSNYNVTSPRIDLQKAGWKPGKILRFEFEPNDIGVADFTGMKGLLSDGTLRFFGGPGIADQPPPRPGEVVLELRKMPPRPQPQPTTSEPAAETP